MSTSRETGGQDKRERIGDYILSGEIGRGSFATVYKGYRSVRPILSLPIELTPTDSGLSVTSTI